MPLKRVGFLFALSFMVACGSEQTQEASLSPTLTPTPESTATPTSEPTATFTPEPTATFASESSIVEDETWQIQVISTSVSTDTLRDTQNNTVSPNPGFVFLIVEANIVNKSEEEQSYTVGFGAGPAAFSDSNGEQFAMGGLRRGSLTTVQSLSTISFSQFYPNAPDGEVIQFYFVVPEGTESGQFQFMEADPIDLSNLNN